MSRGRGSLIVFEGPDGVGKSAIATAVRDVLQQEGHQQVSVLAFPGNEAGTLGNHVYLVHHDPGRFGIRVLSPTSLQLLHVAAHVDAIEREIRPRIDQGALVFLDRFGGQRGCTA